jgi:hypothetical protein
LGPHAAVVAVRVFDTRGVPLIVTGRVTSAWISRLFVVEDVGEPEAEVVAALVDVELDVEVGVPSGVVDVVELDEDVSVGESEDVSEGVTSVVLDELELGGSSIHWGQKSALVALP